MIKDFLALISSLTTIPFKQNRIEDAAKAFHLVPLIGIIEGIFIALPTYFVFKLINILDIASLIYVILHIVITGGIHIDGYADYIDGIGSRRIGSELLKVMKDPRKGTFAIIAIVLNLLLSYTCLKILLTILNDVLSFTSTLLGLYVTACEVMYLIAFLGIPEPYQGLSRNFVIEAKSKPRLIMNISIFTGMIVLCYAITSNTLLYISILFSISIAITVGFAIERDSRSRLGFITGDILGFSYEVAKMIMLIFIIFFFKIFSNYNL